MTTCGIKRLHKNKLSIQLNVRLITFRFWLEYKQIYDKYTMDSNFSKCIDNILFGELQ